MSCEDCNANPRYGAYYRWGIANIEIVACEKHILEVFEALNKAQKIKGKNK